MANKTKSEKKNANYTYEQFVDAWMTSTTVAQVAEVLGLSKQTVSQVATRLRKTGVKLKKFATRTPRPVDVSGLNKQIARAGN